MKIVKCWRRIPRGTKKNEKSLMRNWLLLALRLPLPMLENLSRELILFLFINWTFLFLILLFRVIFIPFSWKWQNGLFADRMKERNEKITHDVRIHRQQFENSYRTVSWNHFYNAKVLFFFQKKKMYAAEWSNGIFRMK